MKIRNLLVVPFLDPDGIEVKLWFEKAPDAGEPVRLRVGKWHEELKYGKRLFLPLPGAPRWTPDAPNLLDLSVEVAGERREVRFGLRRVDARGEKLLLNGAPFYVRGFGCDGDKCGSLARQVETQRGYRNYVARAREFGFNTMRLHRILENDATEEFLQVCDELGLFMWPELLGDPKGDWSALARYANHPCVIWWCWGNELGGFELLPWANEAYTFMKQADPGRMVMDNSGWGTYDRASTDVFSHHMGFTFPLGKNARCYSSYALFTAEAAVHGEDLSEAMRRMREGTFCLGKPLIAHETGTHQCFPEVERRKTRMGLLRRPELVAKLASDERAGWVGKWALASGRFKQMADKVWMEQVRKSPIIEGFEMWMLCDHVHVFSGLVEDGDDCAIKPGIEPARFREHNAPDVLLVNFPEDRFPRVFAPGEHFALDVMASVYGPEPLPEGTATWRFRRGSEELTSGQARLGGAPRGRVSRLGTIEIIAPLLTEATGLVLELEMPSKTTCLSNRWNVWVFPEPSTVETGCVRVVRGLTPDLLSELDGGGRIILLLEDPSTILRTDQAFSSVLARFRPQVWEWGHNLGACVNHHPAMAGFPHEGFSDVQFFHLIDFGRKMILDGCPFAPEPIVHAVDIPMMTYSPEVYARKAAYLFELQVGRGKLLVSGFNFSDQAMRHVEVRTLFASLVRYAAGESFQPTKRVDLAAFRAWTDVVAEKAPARPGADIGGESTLFYEDRDKNGLNKFADRGEPMPVVEISP